MAASARLEGGAAAAVARGGAAASGAYEESAALASAAAPHATAGSKSANVPRARRRALPEAAAGAPVVAVPVAIREGLATPGYGDEFEADEDAEGAARGGAAVVAEAAMSGGVAGGLAEFLLYPVDTIKTRMMVAGSWGGGALFKGMYAGVGTSTSGAVVQTALFFGCYEPLRRDLQERLPKELSSVAQFTSAAVASVISTVVRQPLEVAKQHMQTACTPTAVVTASGTVSAAVVHRKVTFVGAVNSIVSVSGKRGLFAGLTPVLLRDVPFNAIEFTVYEQLKAAYIRMPCRRRAQGQAQGGGAGGDNTEQQLSATEAATLGGLAGMVTGAITTPLDVIKTRLMDHSSLGGARPSMTGMAAAIVREEGVGALFAGIGPRLLWIGVGGVIFFSALEQTEALLARRREQAREERREERRRLRERQRQEAGVSAAVQGLSA